MDSRVHADVKHGRWPPSLYGLLGLLVVLGAGTLFATLAGDVSLRQDFPWDAPVALTIHQYSSPWLDILMAAITQTGENIALLITLVLLAWFAWRRQLLDAAALAVSFGGAVALEMLLKLFFTRPRPEFFPPIVVETGYSFPSGHVMVAVSLYGLLAVMLWQQHHRGWAVLSCGWILLVALTRIYLGVHFPSDVLASLNLGFLWLSAVVVARQWFQPRLPARFLGTGANLI